MDKYDYISEITLLRLYPTFKEYWESCGKNDSEFHILIGIYKDLEESKAAIEENYNWRIGLAKTALNNGWKL